MEGETWIPESDYETKEEAAERVHYLNGGDDDESLLTELRKKYMFKLKF